MTTIFSQGQASNVVRGTAGRMEDGTTTWIPASIRQSGLKTKKTSFFRHIDSMATNGRKLLGVSKAGPNVTYSELTTRSKTTFIQP